MNDNSPDLLVQQFLDGTLDSRAEADALRRIAEDPDARALLRVEGKLQRWLAEEHRHRHAVPPGFTDRVMRAVDAADAPETAPTWQQRMGEIVDALFQPRSVEWRPAYALPLVLLLVAIPLLLPFASSDLQEVDSTDEATTQAATPVEQASMHDDEPVLVRFVFVDEDASSVAVAGDFNYWEPQPLNRQEVDGRTVWSGLMAVSSGEHRYMFVLDGEEWVTDPFAPQARDDVFGAPNAILSL